MPTSTETRSYPTLCMDLCVLPFHPITLNDQEWITSYYNRKNFSGAQFTFAANYIWRHSYHIEVCELDNYFFMKSGIDGSPPYFRCPIGFDGASGLHQAVEKLRLYSKENHNLPLTLSGVSESDKLLLESLYPSEIEITENRDEAEYLYDRDALAQLSGKKYHSKRNHIKRFMDNDWRYETLTPDLLPDCLALVQKWCEQNDCHSNPDKCREGCAAREALLSYEALNLRGGVLYQNGEAVAYTVGEPTGNNTFAVHFEKAYAEIQGAYPAINQLFVQSETEGYTLINREEDTGSEGLRKAKLSYHPTALLPLYTVRFFK